MEPNQDDLNLLRDIQFKRGGFIPTPEQREQCEQLRAEGFIDARIRDLPPGARGGIPPVTFMVTEKGKALIRPTS